MHACSVILTLDLHPAVRLHLLTPSIYLRPRCRCALHSSASPSFAFSCFSPVLPRVRLAGVALHSPAPDPGSARRPECIVLRRRRLASCFPPSEATLQWIPTAAGQNNHSSQFVVAFLHNDATVSCFTASLLFFSLLFFFYKQYFHFLSLGVAHCVVGHRVQCQLLPVLSVAGVEGQFIQ